MPESNDLATRTIKTGVVMDPIAGINIKKDSTFAMLLEAQGRGHSLYYMEPADLRVQDAQAMASMHRISVQDDAANWFSLEDPQLLPLAELDIILMRRDPPFDLDYIYLTYILELAEATGVLVINKPNALRDANEKFFISHFPQCCVPMVIPRNAVDIREFVEQYGKSVVKPLDGMGGDSIFQLQAGDLNSNVILETITKNASILNIAIIDNYRVTSDNTRIKIVINRILNKPNSI